MFFYNFTPFFFFFFEWALFLIFFLFYIFFCVTCFYISLFQTITLKNMIKKSYASMKFTVHFIRFCYSEDDTFFLLGWLLFFPSLIHIKKKLFLDTFWLSYWLYFIFLLLCVFFFFLNLSFKGCWQKNVTQSKKKKKIGLPFFESISRLLFDAIKLENKNKRFFFLSHFFLINKNGFWFFFKGSKHLDSVFCILFSITF